MEEKDFFPLFVNVKNKKILIIGAGKIAYRKTETLLKYGADILVITKEIREEGFKNLKNIDIKIGEFSENLLKNAFMVICATDNKELNEKIYKICDEKNILVNNITSKTDMNCRFGSIINNEEYTLGISAKGNPKKAKELREKLEKIL
ncbi:bifunctional precorrin-2 dehydrogenase/sirohydrochlorin ferrochelatase [Fusobacterium sp. SB021]|uniref:precorrin-2 dehydrogenase/sirohydrochlorin ferrochelatase family protein n=1 Tax=Fusobacterium sp. SB021 TaxID=2744227 RepID=UPI003CFAD1C0